MIKPYNHSQCVMNIGQHLGTSWTGFGKKENGKF